jgi:hypothetical protein
MKGLYPVPFQYAGRELLRVPYFWADDYELAQAVPDWSPGACESIPGLRVYGFHPLSIVLNASSLGVFTELRSITDDWSLLEPAQLAPMVNRTRGVGDFFRDLLARLGRKPPALLRHLLDDGR